MAELLLVPGTSSKTKEELPQKFRGKIIMDFKKKRCEAKAALLAELSKVTCDGISDELSDAVSKLKAALGTDAKQHVPSVLVVFRDSFDTALGDVFGGIVSRTVEREKNMRKGGSGGRGGGSRGRGRRGRGGRGGGGSRGRGGGEGEEEEVVEAEEGGGGEGEEEEVVEAEEGEVGEEVE